MSDLDAEYSAIERLDTCILYLTGYSTCDIIDYRK